MAGTAKTLMSGRTSCRPALKEPRDPERQRQGIATAAAGRIPGENSFQSS